MVAGKHAALKGSRGMQTPRLQSGSSREGVIRAAEDRHGNRDSRVGLLDISLSDGEIGANYGQQNFHQLLIVQNLKRSASHPP